MSALRTFLGASVLIAIGCGGSTESPNAADSGATDGTAGSSTSSSGGSTSGSSSGSSGDDGSSSAGDDSSVPVEGPDGSGVIPPGNDAAAPFDGGVTTPLKGTDGGTDQIACGDTPCDSATQICCATNMGESCTTPDKCKGDVLSCSGTNSCLSSDAGADAVCCLSGAGTNHASSKCDTKCGRDDLHLCTTNADCTVPGDACFHLRNTDLAACGPEPKPRPDGGGGFMGMKPPADAGM